MKKNAKKTEGSQEEKQVNVQLTLRQVLRESLHEMVVLTGMEVLQRVLEEERTEVCGPRYAHDPQRDARRAGFALGELMMAGRRVQVRRPRARTVDGAHEVTLPSWEQFSSEDVLDRKAVNQMVLGVSTRNYRRSLDPLPQEVEERGTSRSAVSRRFVSATKTQLETVLNGNLGDLRLAALMIDGVHFAGHMVLVALGIDEDGHKHVMGLWEGATENASATRALLSNLQERGMATDRSLLVVIDGAKALAKAVRQVFGRRALIQRCQVHKKRNVLEHLPEKTRVSVGAVISQAYGAKERRTAERLLRNLANRLVEEHPGAAASLEEGLEETLTIVGLGLPNGLHRTLATTNAIENLIGRVQHVSHNVKRWRGGTMILRWVAAGTHEASKGFRRLRGYKGMPKLVEALRANDVILEDKSRVRRVA